MNWLKLVLSVLAMIPTAVRLAEPLFGKSSGSEKREVVTTVTATVATVAGANPEQVTALTQAAGIVADVTVSVLNAVGVFKKSDNKE